MGQFEVYEFLKKNKKKWYTANDIIRLMKLSRGSVTTALFKLKKWSMVEFRKKDSRVSEYRYSTGAKKKKRPVGKKIKRQRKSSRKQVKKTWKETSKGRRRY